MTPPKERVLTVRIDVEMSAAMEVLRERHGTPISEQVRRALRAWLEEQGVIRKAARPRARTRERA